MLIPTIDLITVSDIWSTTIQDRLLYHIFLSVFMLNDIMVSAIMLNAIMLNVIMLNVIMLSVVILNAVMLECHCAVKLDAIKLSLPSRPILKTFFKRFFYSFCHFQTLPAESDICRLGQTLLLLILYLPANIRIG